MGNIDEVCAVEVGRLFECLEELEEVSWTEHRTRPASAHRQSLLLGHVKAFPDDSWMDTFLDVPVRLFQQFPNEQNHGSRAVSHLLILSNSCPGNHSGGRVLRTLSMRA